MTLSENSDGEGWMSDRRSGVPRRRRREVRHDIPSAGAPLPLPRGLGAGPGGGLGRGAPRPREAAREPLGKRDRRPEPGRGTPSVSVGHRSLQNAWSVAAPVSRIAYGRAFEAWLSKKG